MMSTSEAGPRLIDRNILQNKSISLSLLCVFLVISMESFDLNVNLLNAY